MDPIRLAEINPRQRFEHRIENESAGGDSPVQARVPSGPSPDLVPIWRPYLDARTRRTSEAERSVWSVSAGPVMFPGGGVFGPGAPAHP